MQTINLENVMRELRMLSGRPVTPGIRAESGSSAETISTQFGSPYQSTQMQGSSDDEPEIYGFVPEHMKKKKKKKKKSETHLIKPSDLFKN